MGRNPDSTRLAAFSGHKVNVIFFLIDPCGLISVSEIEETEKLLSLVVSSDAEDVVIVCIERPCIRICIEELILRADLLDLPKRVEQFSLPRIRICAERCLVPVEVSSVQVTAVLALDRVIVIGIIVLLADLIAAVENRDTGLREQECMQHHVKLDGFPELPLILLVLSRLNPAERGSRAAQTRIAEARIVIVELAAGIASPVSPLQIIIDIFLVRNFLDPELFQEIKVKAPADIVVAAQIVQENELLRQREYVVQSLSQKSDVLGSDCIPGRAHRRRVIEHMAFRLVYGSEIRSQLGGLHNDLAEKERARADDFRCHAHQPDERMDLRQIAVIRAELLPDIRNSIQTDNVDSVIAEVQHVRRHIIEHDRIAVIEIPLIRVEHRHDRFSDRLDPGEVTGSSRREDLRDRLLKFIGDRPVIIEEISVLIFLLSGTGALCPLMILTRVIHDEVKADAESLRMAVLRELIQIFHRAEFRLDFSEIRDRITAVAAVLRALKERHQMDKVRAAFLDIIQVRMNSLQVSGEAIRVNDHAKHIISLVPVRYKRSCVIPLPKKRVSVCIVVVQHCHKIIECLLIIVVEFTVQPFHLVIMDLQALNKLRFPVLIDHFSLPALFEISTDELNHQSTLFNYSLLIIIFQILLILF